HTSKRHKRKQKQDRSPLIDGTATAASRSRWQIGKAVNHFHTFVRIDCARRNHGKRENLLGRVTNRVLDLDGKGIGARLARGRLSEEAAKLTKFNAHRQRAT